MNLYAHKRLAGLMLILPALAACPEIEGNDDQLNLMPAKITVQPSEATASTPITVDISATLSLNAKSELEQVAVSALGIGVCFVEGHNVDEINGPLVEDGYCDIEGNSLSENYQLLDDTTYFKELDDTVIRYGEDQTFEHSLTFTVSDPAEISVFPTLFYRQGNDSLPQVVSTTSAAEVTFTQP